MLQLYRFREILLCLFLCSTEAVEVLYLEVLDVSSLTKDIQVEDLANFRAAEEEVAE